MTPSDRPLSPHLQVYKPQLTTMLSILHRACGVALALGSLMVVWWLVAAACGPEAFGTAQQFAASPLGTFMIFGWSVALFYHLCNGVRHLIWDTGHLLKIENAYRAGYAVLCATVLLTAAVWGCALKFSPDAALSAPIVSDTLANTTPKTEGWQ
ncbi:MAG: succinate dehydrogenase, cytochrome b556 subunit [Alphaproteobacteria bacterium]|nr:succinate dehydrogenase, cytochrome b556 subunit [Alphaproteobacteria bacterium]